MLNKPTPTQRPPFTLIEAVIFIVLVAVAFVPLMAVLGSVVHQSADLHSFRTAQPLAAGLIERESGREFDEIESYSIPPGELSSTHPRFGAEMYVYYVEPGDFDQSAGTDTDLKRLDVSVFWGEEGEVKISTLVAR